MSGIQFVRLKECCQVIGGATPKRNVPEYWGNDVPWITPKDISNLDSPVLEDAPEYISKIGYKNCATYLLPKHSILLTSRAPIGNVAIAGRDMCTNQGFKSLVPGDDVDYSYLYHCIKYMSPKLQVLGNGATFKEVSKKIVEEFKIPLPPLAVQKRIAAILDKADALRRKRQQAIDLTDQLLRSVFLDMFGDPVTNPKGWEKVPMVDVATNDKRAIVDGPFGASLKTEEYVEDGIPVIRINNVRIAGFYNANFKFITELKYKELIRSKVTKGDLLIARVGHTIGKACIFNQEYKALLSTTGVAKVTCDTKKMLPDFLETLWNFKNYQDYIMTKVRGAAQPYLNLTTIKAFEVIKPPVEQQIKFLEVVERTQKTFLSHEKSRDSLDMLFYSLTQQAFRGELTKQTEAA